MSFPFNEIQFKRNAVSRLNVLRPVGIDGESILAFVGGFRWDFIGVWFRDLMAHVCGSTWHFSTRRGEPIEFSLYSRALIILAIQ